MISKFATAARTARGTLVAACIALALAASPARGAEEFDRFVTGLRQRQMHDAAVDYLERMRTSELVSAEDRARIDYELGVTLVEAAGVERDPALKAKYLDRARTQLDAFVAQAADSPLLASAEMQLANVLVERARGLLERADRPAESARKEQLRTEARALFEQAAKGFSAAEEKLVVRLKAMQEKVEATGRTAGAQERDQLRNDLLQARLYAGQALYESSKSWDEGSDDRAKRLKEAAERFNELFTKYRTRFVGLVARLYQGRCFQDLGDTKQALSYYAEISVQPDEPDALRQLKTHALRLSMECWAAAGDASRPEAIEKGRAWLKSPQSAQDRTLDGLGIRYMLAVAIRQQAEADKSSDAARAALTEVRDLAREVAAVPSEYRERARAMYSELAGTPTTSDELPAKFPDARDRGKETLDALVAKQTEQKVRAEKGELDQDPAARKALDDEIATLRDSALRLFEHALTLSSDETAVDDLNLVRYYLCYLHYEKGDYYQAAILGDFLARRYPTSAMARSASKIALASFVQLYSAAPREDRNFERAQMAALADLIARRWAGQPEADEAWNILIDIAARDRDNAQITQLLEQVPQDSPQRGPAELKAGQTMWAGYLETLRSPPADEGGKAAQAELRSGAQALLEKGLERVRANGSAASATIAGGMLALAQVYVDAGEPDKAIALLEDPSIGPLTLVRASSPTVAQGNVAIETAKLALRAYVSARQLDKAEQTLELLDQLSSGAGAADVSASLTKVYVALGRQLEEQLVALRSQGKEEQAREVSRGFQSLLERIAGRQSDNRFESLNWVAETYNRLARGMDTGDAAAPPDAVAYYEKAAELDHRIVESAASNPAYVDAKVLPAVKLRLATSLRRTGKFDEATALLVAILEAQPSLLDVQKEAAYVYQDRGQVDPTYFNTAIVGGHRVKEQNLIWGWGRLANAVQRNPKYRDTYFEARYNTAKCHFLPALAAKDAERTQFLVLAESDVMLTARLHPDVGGNEWHAKFDELLKKIQKEAGKTVTGLPKPEQASGKNVVVTEPRSS